jgi:hypothetical protein
MSMTMKHHRGHCGKQEQPAPNESKSCAGEPESPQWKRHWSAAVQWSGCQLSRPFKCEARTTRGQAGRRAARPFRQ